MRAVLGSLWYNLSFYVCYLVMTLGFSLRMQGTRHLPRRGPFLIIANHQSFFDPPSIGVACSPLVGRDL